LPVYFIQSIGGGPIKIGHSDSPIKRLATLQTSHYEKLTILATVDGGLTTETKLHERFSKDRLHGEWFTPSEELMQYINQHRPQKERGDLKFYCIVCKKEVADGKGYVHLLGDVDEYRKLVREWEATHGRSWDSESEKWVIGGSPETGKMYNASELLDHPEQPGWGVHHSKCDPNRESGEYWFGVDRCRSYPELIDWTAHLLEKNWFTDTDWPEFLRQVLRTQGEK